MSALYHSTGFRLVAVDPGLRGCGVALFQGGTLLRAAYVKNNGEGRGYAAHVIAGASVQRWLMSEGDGLDALVVELPRVYPGSAQQKGDLNDLLDVAGVGAAVATALRFDAFAGALLLASHVFPSDWKGNVPKETMTERIRRSLTDEERRAIEKCPASLMHNVLDACGIGLHKLGRLNKKVYPHAD